jgi:hypothetical protein
MRNQAEWKSRFSPNSPLVSLAGLTMLCFLSGCAAVGLTLFGVGAGVTTGTAVAYTLDGTAYRTFTVPLLKVETATVAALHRMGMKLEGREGNEQSKIIKASGAERQIEVELEAISPKTTRLRSVAKQGVFFKDRATATEIILQTEKVLNGT